MVSKIDNALAFQSQVLGLRAARQQVLAANIANADTPNYKARDFDFSTALKTAVAGRGNGDLQLATNSPRHLPAANAGGVSSTARLLYRTPAQMSADGNSVEMDAERAEFAQNAIHYEAAIAFITHQIRLQSAALQG